MEIEGLSGEVFNLDGRNAIQIPGVGREGAFRFQIIRFHPANGSVPAWADMMVDDLCCRINPDICRPPFTRLADCISLVAQVSASLSEIKDGWADWTTVWMPPQPHPASERFVFAKTQLRNAHVIMIDTWERVERHGGKQPFQLN